MRALPLPTCPLHAQMNVSTTSPTALREGSYLHSCVCTKHRVRSRAHCRDRGWQPDLLGSARGWRASCRMGGSVPLVPRHRPRWRSRSSQQTLRRESTCRCRHCPESSTKHADQTLPSKGLVMQHADAESTCACLALPCVYQAGQCSRAFTFLLRLREVCSSSSPFHLTYLIISNLLLRNRFCFHCFSS